MSKIIISVPKKQSKLNGSRNQHQSQAQKYKGRHKKLIALIGKLAPSATVVCNTLYLKLNCAIADKNTLEKCLKNLARLQWQALNVNISRENHKKAGNQGSD